MLKIKICDENKDKINEIIMKAEGKARVRRVDFSDCVWLAKKAEKHLDIYELPEKLKSQCKIFYKEIINSPWYKGEATSTHIGLLRGSNGFWYLIDVERIEIKPGWDHDYSFEPTAKAIEYVKEKEAKRFKIF